MKVLIAQLTAELARYPEYYDSLTRLVTPAGTEILPVHSSSPAKNRNIIIKAVLEADSFTHIFFTDDDHTYEPNTLMRLLSHNVDIVSGMYCMKFKPFPIIALANTRDTSMSQFVDMNKIGNPGLVEIPRVPAGCLLVSTQALKMMRSYLRESFDKQYWDKWFTIGQIIPDEWGDDLWFCDVATEAGIEVYLDTMCPVWHLTKSSIKPVWNDTDKCWEIDFGVNEGYQIGEILEKEST